MGFLSKLVSFMVVLNGVSGTSSVVNCNTESLFVYESGVLNPPNPLPNTNTTLELTFTNNYSELNSGIIDFSVNVNGLPYAYSEPICSPNLPCPIQLGQHIVYSNPIDVGTITGKLVITTHYKDDVGNVLLCVMVTMKLPNTAKNSVQNHNQNQNHNHNHNSKNALVPYSSPLSFSY
jgi:hypothetical protein